MIADAIYAAAEPGDAQRLASDQDVDRADRIIRRFLAELPGDLSVADICAELVQVGQ